MSPDDPESGPACLSAFRASLMSLEVQFLFGCFGIRMVFLRLRREMADLGAPCQIVLPEGFASTNSSKKALLELMFRFWTSKAVLARSVLRQVGRSVGIDAL